MSCTDLQPIVESIYGPRPDRLSKSEILAPYILDLSSRLLATKTKEEGIKGTFDVLSQSFAGAAPTLNKALGVRRQEDAAERAEQIEIGKTALSLATSERDKLFDSATTLDLQNLLKPDNKAFQRIESNVQNIYDGQGGGYCE